MKYNKFRGRDFDFFIPSLNFFTDKNVLDIASHTGDSTVCISNLNAKSVLGLEPRRELVEISRKFAKENNSNVTFICCDGTDHNLLPTLLNDIDVVTNFGMFYHINDHFNFLKTICTSDVKFLLLETIFGLESSFPTILCNVETTDDVLHGINSEFPKVMTGAPNIVWIKQVLEIFNWQITFFKGFLNLSDARPDGEHARERMVIGATNLNYVDLSDKPKIPEDFWEWSVESNSKIAKVFSIYNDKI